MSRWNPASGKNKKQFAFKTATTVLLILSVIEVMQHSCNFFQKEHRKTEKLLLLWLDLNASWQDGTREKMPELASVTTDKRG